MVTKTVLRCPQCNSADLIYENAMIAGIVYHCKKCDYIGPLVIEDDEEVEVDTDLEKKEDRKGFFRRTSRRTR